MKYFFGFVLAANIISFLLFGIDKHRARQSKRRISEATLLLSAVLCGSIGAFLGMRFFHHKTRKFRFKFGVPAIFVLQLAAAVIYFCFLRSPQSAARLFGF